MKTPITLTFFKEVEEATLRAKSLNSKLIDRVDYIVQTIFKVFNQKRAYWYFHGAEEDEVGDFWKASQDDSGFTVIMEGMKINRADCAIILNGNEEWDLSDSIPIRWLFEDFEEELKEGKKLWDSQSKARLELEMQKEQEEKNLLESAKKKLSKKELEALKKGFR